MFLLGQVLAEGLFALTWTSLPETLLLCSISSIVIYNSALSAWAISLLLPFLCGFGVSGANLISTSRELPQSDVAYVVQVKHIPRHKKPGSVELELEFLTKLERDNITYYLGEQTFNRNPRLLCHAVELPWKPIVHAQKGSYFVIRAKVASIIPSFNVFSYANTLSRHHFSATCKIISASLLKTEQSNVIDHLRAKIINDITKILGNGEQSGMFLSMVLGVQDVLSDLSERSFKRLGLTHVLVVSGYQISLVFMLLYQVLNAIRVKLPERWAGLWLIYFFNSIAIAASAIYLVLVGISGSSLRAALALLLLLLTRLLERGMSMFNCILVSLLTLNLIWPGCFLEPGVQLTYAALFGINLGVQEEGFIKQYLAVSLFASLFTSIIVAAWFGGVSLAGLVLNPILAGLVSIISCKGGVLVLLAYYAGLDSQGEGLTALGTMLILFRDLVHYLAGFEWVYFEFNRALLCAGLMSLSFYLVRSRLGNAKYSQIF